MNWVTGPTFLLGKKRSDKILDPEVKDLCELIDIAPMAAVDLLDMLTTAPKARPSSVGGDGEEMSCWPWWICSYGKGSWTVLHLMLLEIMVVEKGWNMLDVSNHEKDIQAGEWLQFTYSLLRSGKLEWWVVGNRAMTKTLIG